MNAFSAAGLLYDIAGVILLASSLVATKTETLMQQAKLYWGGNKALYVALMTQKFDALWGLPLLILGFAMQLEPALIPSGVGKPHWFWSALAFLAMYLAIYWFARRRHAVSASKRFDENLKEGQGSPKKSPAG